jgi:hypothetical protein
MKTAPETATSSLRRQAAEALQRARKLPVGPDRNEMRQLAIGLLWLEKKGLAAKVLERRKTTQAVQDRLVELEGR